MATERLETSKPLLKLDPATGELEQRVYEVTVVSGPDAGRVVALGDKLVVGSDAGARLRLTDGAVSRYHAELTPRADGVLVRDLGSTNGTFLGAARIEAALLTETEATVRMGKTQLRISATTRQEKSGERASFGTAISISPAMQHLFALLERVAPTDSTVLLTGETGTGKDALARALHAGSTRPKGRLVVVDCGAISAQLIESELFGHTKGAFTGAVAERSGAFLEAHGGTLFLDEIGEMPLDLQPKLLRVLESGTVKRVGDDRERRVDVRVIAATNRDLELEVKAGRFRQDLYFRLAVVPIRLPPLRERTEDLPLLVRHFLREMGREDFELPEQTLGAFRSYHWPGNVRELRNFVGRALAGIGIELPKRGPAADGSKPEPMEDPSGDPVPYKEAKEELLAAFTRTYLADLLRRYDGNISQMARAAGIARFYLRELLQKHGLHSTDPGGGTDASGD